MVHVAWVLQLTVALAAAVSEQWLEPLQLTVDEGPNEKAQVLDPLQLSCAEAFAVSSARESFVLIVQRSPHDPAHVEPELQLKTQAAVSPVHSFVLKSHPETAVH